MIVPEWPPNVIGGGGAVYERLAIGLSERGHEVSVAAGTWTNGAGYSECPGVPLTLIPLISGPRTANWLLSATPPTPLGWARLVKVISQGWDAVHVHGLALSITDIATFIARCCRQNVVLTVHGIPVSPLRRGRLVSLAYRLYLNSVVRRTVRSARIVTAVSGALRIDPIFPMPQAKIIHNGIDLQDPIDLPHWEAGKPLMLLTVGRLSRNKGIDLAIESVSILQARGIDAYLECYGPPGGDEADLADLVETRGLSGRIRFVGAFRPAERRNVFSRYHAMLMPSRVEAFGLAALESLSFGLPLISTQADGLIEFVDNSVAWIATSTPDGVAAAIQEFLSSPRDALDRVSRGITRARSFSWDRQIDAYERVLNDASQRLD